MGGVDSRCLRGVGAEKSNLRMLIIRGGLFDSARSFYGHAICISTIRVVFRSCEPYLCVRVYDVLAGAFLPSPTP